jgi:hypothetical protein
MEYKCPNCGSVNKFPFEFINSHIEIGEEVIMECYKCHSSYKVPEGKFYFDKNGIASILSGPEFTNEALYKLKALTEKAKRERYSPDQFRAEIAVMAIPDRLLKVIIPTNPGEFWGFIAALLAAIALVVAKKSREKTIIINNYYGRGSGPKTKTKPNKNKSQERISEYKTRRNYRRDQRGK